MRASAELGRAFPCAEPVGRSAALAGSLMPHTLREVRGAKTSVNPVVDKHVGTRVRMRRVMLGMSQKSSVTRLGLRSSTCRKYEKGMNRVTASRLQHMSQILRVPVPFFFEGAPGGSTGTAETPSYMNEFLVSSDGLALAKAFTALGMRGCVA
jgi:transcriptional regulator with XRE-family HTH domain